ncbi:MAG TPA: hypothetical protein PLE19_04780 [Planctomycetota bacterium]|nr:hypothetical protein [Planctomycetota bacterium]HRR79103.1 hypothetical protein [Planctomycetota bacterium]HRT93164.1 hypothetical protein [Planctomycetota bacterium]
MRRDLIILANSRKMGNRCIAGIDASSGEWVRPCFGAGEEGIPWPVRQVDGVEPKLLDVISIPLADDGPHRDIQPENCTLLEGAWRRVGEAKTKDVRRHVQKTGFVLHDAHSHIPVSALRRLHEADRASLCLVEAHVEFTTEGTRRGKRVNAAFTFGCYTYCLPVTDFEFERQFPAYSRDEADCLLAVSLGTPFGNCCYKFAAGVIRL